VQILEPFEIFRSDTEPILILHLIKTAGINFWWCTFGDSSSEKEISEFLKSNLEYLGQASTLVMLFVKSSFPKGEELLPFSLYHAIDLLETGWKTLN
jgi:hypothetical protein